MNRFQEKIGSTIVYIISDHLYSNQQSHMSESYMYSQIWNGLYNFEPSLLSVYFI